MRLEKYVDHTLHIMTRESSIQLVLQPELQVFPIPRNSEF